MWGGVGVNQVFMVTDRKGYVPSKVPTKAKNISPHNIVVKVFFIKLTDPNAPPSMPLSDCLSKTSFGGAIYSVFPNLGTILVMALIR